ncbi:phage tail protein [Nocardia brasiliensis]|uniref:Gp37-like protein n=1 Tax=Nocardia brasiliensis TaxID=37326 RepID=UPI00245829B8|nr:phage tail protein [Nocardia brasiliensis]
MAVMTADTLAECEAIWEVTEQRERQRQAQRLEPPSITVYDGEWNLHGWIDAEYSGDFEWVDNDTGAGLVELPWDHYVAQWIWDEWGRLQRGEKRNVHIVVECPNGARWSGRLESCSPEKREDGSKVLVVQWLSDYETLKWFTVWSNAALPSILQFPRVFLLAGGARWCLLTALHLQVMRAEQNWWNLPDDPLNPASWVPSSVENWSVVVKPHSFVDDLNDGILWALLAARFKNWHDVAAPILADAELSVVWRRYLPHLGDAQPIPGLNLRPGALVIDIVDKSGYYTGTSNGGTLWDGLVRTVARFASDFVDTTLDNLGDVDVPEYRIPGLFMTSRRKPYVVWLEGDETGIQRSKLTRWPSKGVQVVVGGHSMYGVNEAISAAVQLSADLLSAALFVPAVGGSLDAVLSALYTDTVLSWWNVKSLARARNSGWSRYFEYFADGADRAFTIQSLLVLRAGFWATRGRFAAEVNVNDGSPWVIGDQGRGHCWLGDRVGFGILGDRTGRIHVDRIRSIRLRYSDSEPLSWVPVIGDNSRNQDPAQRALDRLSGALAALHDLGVFG